MAGGRPRTLVIQYRDTNDRPDYRWLSDDQCITLAKQGDRWAADELVHRYRPMVIDIAKRFKATGMDLADFVQLGFLGFLEAIQNYEGTRNVTFITFAYRVVWNRLTHAVAWANRRKYEILNNALSLEECLLDEETNDVSDTRKESIFLKDNTVDVENDVISKYYDQQLMKQIREVLTEEEFIVFLLMTDGERPTSIQKTLNICHSRYSKITERVRKKLQLWLERAILDNNPLVCYDQSPIMESYRASQQSMQPLINQPWEFELEGTPKVRDCCGEIMSLLQQYPKTTPELFQMFAGRFSIKVIRTSIRYLIDKGFVGVRVVERNHHQANCFYVRHLSKTLALDVERTSSSTELTSESV